MMHLIVCVFHPGSRSNSQVDVPPMLLSPLMEPKVCLIEVDADGAVGFPARRMWQKGSRFC